MCYKFLKIYCAPFYFAPHHSLIPQIKSLALLLFKDYLNKYKL